MKKSTKHSSNNVHCHGKRIVAFALSAVFLTACCPIAFAAEDSSAPLTPEQISGMTNEQLAAIPQEQSDATLSKMAQLFKDGEKETLDEYLSALGFATTYEEHETQKEQEWLETQASLNPSIQPLWQSDSWNTAPEKACHENLTSYGILLYIGAMAELFNISGSFGYTLSEVETLSDESAWPDKFGWTTLYADHFYDPDTGKSWNVLSNTARDKAAAYYNDAVDKFKDGKREDALQDLGRGLHFVQDVGVPHHAANLKVESNDANNHQGFEQLASSILLNESLMDNVEFEHDAAFYNACLTQDIGSFVHEIASNSKPLSGYASDKTNDTRQRLAAVTSLSVTVQNTAGVLYKFAKEVGMI